MSEINARKAICKCKCNCAKCNGNNIDSPGYSYISVLNNAGFAARFTVSYMLRGKIITRQSNQFTLFQSDKIYIPNEAILVVLKIQEEAFIDKWVLFYLISFVNPISKCYSLSGSILNPKATEIPCVESTNKF